MPYRYQYPFVPRFCRSCGADLASRDFTAKFCVPCLDRRQADTGATSAHRMVHRAVKCGLLAPVKTLACVDCQAPAAHYDHRDYAKPLEVEPVCHSCNRRRGPARPVLTFELPD